MKVFYGPRRLEVLEWSLGPSLFLLTSIVSPTIGLSLGGGHFSSPPLRSGYGIMEKQMYQNCSKAL